MSELIISNDFYDVFYTDRKSTNVTVVFSSAGALALAEPVEEFKKTIEKFDSSYVFVWSKNLDWYNNSLSSRTLKDVSLFCQKFEKIYAIGESLGGSGALLFSKYCSNLFRILAFSPQYSALPEFCKWQGPLTPLDGVFSAFMFSDYAPESARSKSVLIYPTTSYEDNLHAKFFKGDGFNVVFVDSCHHDMARSLKKDYDRNYLHTVLFSMYSESFDFTNKSYNFLLSEIIEKNKKTFSRWIGNKTFLFSSYIDMPDSNSVIDRDFKCSQSSVCEYSHSKNNQEEATRAILQPLGMGPAFHTNKELNPWWTIEFDNIEIINSIVIFNRCDNESWARRFTKFYVSISYDGLSWKEIYRKENTEVVGGEYGEPIKIDKEIKCKIIKITLIGYNYLHLSKIVISRIGSSA